MYANTNGLCPSGGLDCMPMLADAISAINGAKDTVTFPGVTMLGNDSSWGAAIAAVSQVIAARHRCNGVNKISSYFLSLYRAMLPFTLPRSRPVPYCYVLVLTAASLVKATTVSTQDE
jgi:hypothetical protein